ncbi:MAG: GNAT family N-acetyltransferase [Chitinophagales bacterium]
MTISKGSYSITTDKNLMDIDFIHRFLATSYWAEGITKEIISKCVRGSLCFGVFENQKNVMPDRPQGPVGRQVGFARMVTDEATFAYLADVFIADDHRGKGLSKWLMEVILAHDGLQGLRRILLATRDAHGLYAQFGFTPLSFTDRWMQIHNPDVYKNIT